MSDDKRAIEMLDDGRVRFTDDYVPGPAGCPVWGIEFGKLYTAHCFIRAKTEEEAWDIARQYYKEHLDEMENYVMMSDPVACDTSWRHLDSDQGWREQYENLDDG